MSKKSFDELMNEQDPMTDEEKGEKKSSEFADMLNESFQKPRKKLSAGEKIRCEVLSIGKDEAYVSTGTMHDGQVPKRELLDSQGNVTVKVGDTLELYVVHVKGSEIILSPNKTAKNLADDLEDAFDMMLPVEGRVAEVCKGGFRITLFGKTAFCPVSQIDTKYVETPEDYVGKKFEFMITKFEDGGRNMVVSRRKLLDEQRGVAEASFADEHKEGEVFQGVVTRLEKFGAFVEVVPGIEGLVHISEMSYSRVNDPREVLAVGQQVAVKLLKIETKDGRLKLSLSVKQAAPEPWDNLPSHIRAGAMIEGKVTRCVKFGAFVELAPGVEGLIPLGEMSYTKRVMRSDELVKEGERITVMVKDLNPENHRISLSLKDAGTDPWSMVAHKFPVGTIVQGKVERREPYGLFIQLEEGITGLLPKSKAAQQPEFPFEKLKVGEMVAVQIGELRLEERRISLDVPGDPSREDWKTYMASQGAGQQSGQSSSFGTLGGAFGQALSKALEKKKGK